MATQAEIDAFNAAILAAATAPQRMRHADREIEQHDLDQLLKVAAHIAGQGDAAAQPHRGLTFTRLIPPGGG